MDIKECRQEFWPLQDEWSLWFFWSWQLTFCGCVSSVRVARGQEEAGQPGAVCPSQGRTGASLLSLRRAQPRGPDLYRVAPGPGSQAQVTQWRRFSSGSCFTFRTATSVSGQIEDGPRGVATMYIFYLSTCKPLTLFSRPVISDDRS